jgi:hypothetical protein
MWIAISVTFGITKPANFANLVGPWLRSFSHKQRTLVTVGVAAFCWGYDSVEMMLCSKNQNLNLFCR